MKKTRRKKSNRKSKQSSRGRRSGSENERRGSRTEWCYNTLSVSESEEREREDT